MPRNEADEDDDDYRPRRPRRVDDDDDFDDDLPRGRRRLPRELLRGIAGNQRAIIFCIIGYFCLVVFQFLIPQQIRIYLVAAVLPLAITATVFVFLLATKVYNSGMGTLLGLLTLIPCVGLIVLVIISAKATSILKSHGIRVGLFGANRSDI